MTSINIADTTKLGTLSTQIFEMLKEKGLHPTTESERVISFGQDPIYILGLDTEAEGNIFVHLYARYTTPHFSMNEKFELFNKINHTMKQVKISMVPGEEAVQISCGFWINHFGEFKTAFTAHLTQYKLQNSYMQYKLQLKNSIFNRCQIFQHFKDTTKTMNTDRRIERAKYYCQKLSLNTWDRNDIIKHLTNYYAITDTPSPSPELLAQYNQTLHRINRLELLHIVKRFEEYIEQEESLYYVTREDFIVEEPEAIWNIVYAAMDTVIQNDIDAAKYASKNSIEAHNTRVRQQNTGCIVGMYIALAIFLIWLIWG